MAHHSRRIALILGVALFLCGCSAAVKAEKSSGPIRGVIEVAVTERCADGSDSQCIAVGGEYVALPASFEKVTVTSASVSAEQPNAVDVTLTSQGATTLGDISERAAQGGEKSRLLIKIGKDALAAVIPMASFTRKHVTIALSPESDARKMADLLNGT